MYLYQGVLHQFADENVANLDKLDSNEFSPPKKTFATTNFDDRSLFQSVEEPLTKTKRVNSNFNKEYKDYGKEVFEYLKDEFKRVQKVDTLDPNVLFDFWEQLRKKHRITMKNNKKLMNQTMPSRFANENLEKKKAIFTADPEDINYTLRLYANDAKEESRISTFFQERTLEEQIKERKGINKKKKKFNPEVLNQLCPKKNSDTNSRRMILFNTLVDYQLANSKKDDEIITQKTLTDTWSKMEPRERKSRNIDYYNNLEEVKILLDTVYKEESKKFCEKLERDYKQKHSMALDYKRPKILFDFWRENQEKYLFDKIFKNEHCLENILIKYYYDKMCLLADLFYKRYGFNIDNCKDKNGNITKTKQSRLFEFWKIEIGSNKEKLSKTLTVINEKKDDASYNAKKLNGLEFESDENVKFLIEQYFEEEEYQKKIKEEKQKNERASMEQEKIKTFFKTNKSNEEKEKFFSNISKPKDRLKLGKALLKLKKMFPKDPILMKMIIDEFKESKIAKHPLEYDCFDSDEEDLIKQKKNVGNRKSIKEKEDELYQHFEKEIEDFYDYKTKTLREDNSKKKKEEAEKIEIERFMKKIAKQFISLRKKRYEEKIPTLNEFLSKNYKQLNKNHKIFMKNMFPHLKYGESRSLKQRSYPLSFKHYFFQMVRSFIKDRDRFQTKTNKKLGFWAPPSISKCNLHENNCPMGCKFQSLNKKVLELSRNFKEKEKFDKSQNNKSQNKVWALNSYLKDRLKIMMRIDDANNCTFAPSFAQSFISEKSGGKKGFDKWVKEMGENFMNKFPMIYKYGVFNIARRIYSEGKILESYKRLAEVFDIPKIKLHFNPNTKPLRPISPFLYDSLIDRSKVRITYEDLNTKEYKKYTNMMFEVYNLICELEKHEDELLRSKLEGERMSNAERKLKSLRPKNHKAPTLDKKLNDKRDIFQKALNLKHKKKIFDAYQLLKKSIEDINKENEKMAKEKKEKMGKINEEEKKLMISVKVKPTLNELINRQIQILCRKLETEIYEKDRGSPENKRK